MFAAGQPLRRPLVGISVSIVVGILNGSYGGMSPEFAFLLSLVFGAGAVCFRKKIIGTVCVFLTISSLAAALYGVSDLESRNASIESSAVDLPQADMEVVGQVISVPRYYAYKNGRGGMWIFSVGLEGEHVERNRWKTRTGKLEVRVLGGQRTQGVVERGQRVWLRGELEKPYHSGGALRLRAYSVDCCVALSDPEPTFAERCQQCRSRVARRLEVGIQLHPEEASVLKALVLGFRKDVPKETYARFKRTGLLHIFAISGLHVGIIGILLTVVLKSMGVPRDWLGVWLLPLLFIYVVATGMQSSALRALVMAGVYLLAPLFRRKPDVPSSVAFAAAALLIMNPHALESVGFIFSFLIVSFIVMVYAKVPKVWLAGGGIKAYMISLVLTSFAASLASFPISAYCFGRFSPIALAGNLVVVPLTFCIVLTGWLSILIPPASAVFNYAAVAFSSWMLRSMEFLDGIPGSSFEVQQPPLIALLLWYAGLVYLFTHATRRKQVVLGISGAAGALLWVVCAQLIS